jgi:hypothetical protein
MADLSIMAGSGFCLARLIALVTRIRQCVFMGVLAGGDTASEPTDRKICRHI